MKKQRGQVIEVETLDDFDRRIDHGEVTLDGWHLRGLDLRDRSQQLARLNVTGSLFLGCSFANGIGGALRERGALIFPSVPDVPIRQYRGELYTPAELYAGLSMSYEQTPDARIYAWAKQTGSRELALAKALHDHSIDEALTDFVTGRRLVGVMGGHALERGTVAYGAAAHLGRDLARQGLFVCTGGGPGAMEAANLGAYFSAGDAGSLDEAITMLARVPSFTPSIAAWASAAFGVRERWPHGAESLGIPTWYYGHEPPNPFATSIAKYFKNSTREDTLLHICSAGLVFLPGAGGTVQEIFAEACENYYAGPTAVAPMVLVGARHWTETLPAWPLLTSLARGRTMESSVHLVDDLSKVAALLAR